VDGGATWAAMKMGSGDRGQRGEKEGKPPMGMMSPADACMYARGAPSTSRLRAALRG